MGVLGDCHFEGIKPKSREAEVFALWAVIGGAPVGQSVIVALVEKARRDRLHGDIGELFWDSFDLSEGKGRGSDRGHRKTTRLQSA